jgi:hypothetical protein
MNKTAMVGIVCANPECDAAFSFGFRIIDTEPADVTVQTKHFNPVAITCPKCGLVIQYFQENLKQFPLVDDTEK